MLSIPPNHLNSILVLQAELNERHCHQHRCSPQSCNAVYSHTRARTLTEPRLQQLEPFRHHLKITFIIFNEHSIKHLQTTNKIQHSQHTSKYIENLFYLFYFILHLLSHYIHFIVYNFPDFLFLLLFYYYQENQFKMLQRKYLPINTKYNSFPSGTE